MTTVDRPLLEISGLTVDHPQRGRPPLRAVDGVDLAVTAGSTLGIVGESGSGKSTVAGAVTGLVPVTAGRITFDGEEITHAGRARRRELARELQIVFQDPYHSLNPARTVGQTLGESLRYAAGLTTAAVRARVAELLDWVGLPASAAERYPVAFSGGQRQRIAIARALAPGPRLVVCDEPVSALDLSVQAQILNLLRELQRTTGVTFVFISHDLAVVRHFADELAVMHRGRVVERGPAAELYDHPAHEYTRALLLAAPLPDPRAQAARRAARRSTPTSPVPPTSRSA